MRRRDHNIFFNIGSLVLCGVLAGVVVAAALFPGVAISGLAAKAGAEEFDQLPTELKVDTAPQMSYIYARDGKKIIATMYDEHRRDIPLSEVPQILIDALIAAEDKTFYQHNGVDPQGILRAFVANTSAGQTTQGASTITQQVVRMSLTYFAKHPQDALEATEQTTGRKLRETRYAMALEKECQGTDSGDLLQPRVLRSGRLRHLRRQPGVLRKAPRIWSSTRPRCSPRGQGSVRSRPLDRRERPLARTGGTGCSTRWWRPARSHRRGGRGQGDRGRGEADASPTTASPPQEPLGFLLRLLQPLVDGAGDLRQHRYERERRLKGGGFRIVTTLDVEIQEAAKKHVEDNLKTGNPEALMLAAVEPGTGKVRAMAVNRHFGLDDPQDPKNGSHTNPRAGKGVRGSYPNTTNPLVAGGGDMTGYQGGSTFKVFTIVAALEPGIPLAYTIDSPAGHHRLPGGAGRPGLLRGNQWCPSNSTESVGGVHNMWSGLGRSVNTYFAQLIERAGAQNVVDMAARLGVKFRAEQDAQYAANADAWGAFTLGVSATTPLDLANSYATISAEGKHCEPIPVEEIRTMDGEKLDIANPICKRVVDKDVARATVDAGRCVVGDQSHFGRCRAAPPRNPRHRRQADWGKTGTSDGSGPTRSWCPPGRSPSPPSSPIRTGPRPPAHAVASGARRRGTDPRRCDEGHRPGQLARPGEQQTRPRRPGQHPLGGVPIGGGGALHPEQRRLPGRVQETPVDSACAGRSGGRAPAPAVAPSAAATVTIRVSNGSGFEREREGTRRGGNGIKAGSQNRRQGAGRAPDALTKPRLPLPGTAGQCRRCVLGLGGHVGPAQEPSASWRRTSAATRPPSARPATVACTAFIAGPIAPGR